LNKILSKKIIFLEKPKFFMYKKLNIPTLINFIFTISTITFSSVCLSLVIPKFFDSISFFDLILSLPNNSFFFDIIDESTAIDTEIVARRLGSGLATAGLGGVGTGIGLVFSGLIKGFSRNPSLQDDLFSYAIFGFALTEAIGLFALMMAFMLLYA
jgi:F-type H+-transporting ATPase subunit c